MMESIVFKKAGEADISAVKGVTRKAFTNYAKEIRREDSVAALHETDEAILSDILHKHVYICRVDGETAGAPMGRPPVSAQCAPAGRQPRPTTPIRRN